MFAVCIYGIKFRVGSVGGWKVEGRWVAFGVAVGRALCGEETIFKISLFRKLSEHSNSIFTELDTKAYTNMKLL